LAKAGLSYQMLVYLVNNNHTHMNCHFWHTGVEKIK